jgi:rapamycin-insensitive companion of mTOR
MAPEFNTAASMTPTQNRAFASYHASRKSDDAVPKLAKNSRSYSNSSAQYGPRGSSLASSAVTATGPGSFSTDLRTTTFPRSTTPRPELLAMSRVTSNGPEDDDLITQSEHRQAIVRDKIAKEMKIKLGTENMLEALQSKNAKQTKEQRQKVEMELGTSKRKLQELHQQLNQEIQRAQTPTTPPRRRMSSYFRGSPMKSPPIAANHITDEPASDAFEGESPSLVLTEILQALEVEGMQPDYYIDRANTLVELFKRHPTLKYDLAWSVFSLRIQMMLLSDSTDVVAAGYRLTRYAIADRSSLKTIRALHTDEIVILSLVKKGQAVLEREQAVKFVRAFLDVKDGAREVSRAVVRAIVAVAEQHDDRLRHICVLTLAEILMQDAALLIQAGGLNTLTEILSEGTFHASESLVVGFLRLLDVPHRRRYLKSGREVETIFAPLTDPLIASGHEDRLKTSVKAISAMLKTWPGLLALSRNNAVALRSLLQSLQYPTVQAKDLILELLFDVFRIKAPSWSSTFLAGRRLTTYGRGSNVLTEPAAKRIKYDADHESQRIDLTAHFSTLVLATFLRAGLIRVLTDMIRTEEDLSMNRKATLLLTEVLRFANYCFPKPFASELQVLGDLVTTATITDTDEHAVNAALIFQIESINRTLNRISSVTTGARGYTSAGEIYIGSQSGNKSKINASMDGEQFRQAVVDTQVANHTNFIKWKWDIIHSIVEGPLTNLKRLEEVLNSKFLKRLTGFYRPFKYRFSTVRNTRPNQRYVRTGCALIKSLMQTALGIQYLMENKLLRQVAECLAQVDRLSGLTSTAPFFDRVQMVDTLSGGYFAMIGTLSQTTEGIIMMEKWHMINMFYHIIDLRDREDLVETLLGNLDFAIDSHLRVLLSKALTAGSKEIRLFATKLLRRYAISHDLSESAGDATDSRWVLNMLLTQLYDPDVEVCEIAVKNLEEACNRRSHLEYVVKCRPSLDHLGEIGAPLLLRFLSTSVGYHYLDGLDYITQEMDDWFLGRNDTYVTLVEASLARAYTEQANQKSTFISNDDALELEDLGVVPPHFYRELARTEEGCGLLEKSGHFNDFATIVRDFDLDEEDGETLTKVKGCLWAIGNVGSMDLGAPFLLGTEIVSSIVAIAEGAEVMSLRGTAFFVLGLISRSKYGLEMLLELGWNSAVDDRGRSLGLCLPEQLNKLCSVSNYASRYRILSANHFQITFRKADLDDAQSSKENAEKYKAAATDADAFNARVLKAVIEMGNTVLAKRVAVELNGLKSRHQDAFKQVSLFKKTLVLLESHHYRLWQRQFILDLFDKGIIRRIVLEEDMADEMDSGRN